MLSWRRSWPTRRVEGLDTTGYNSRAVKEHDTPPETFLCGRCATLCEPEDNFCRSCGLTLTEQYLPTVRNGQSLPAVWQPRVRSAVVKGAAFVAAGTLAEAFLRRLVRRTLARSSGGGAQAARDKQDTVSREGGPLEDPQFVDDTLLLRHIRIRR